MSERIIFHVDVNSAFLSWEAMDRLKKGSKVDLRQVPSIVGGDMEKRHGVVLAKSIPAKKFGIKTGEPVSDAFKKCPHLLSVLPNFKLYTKCSYQLRTLLEKYFPVMEQTSVDEMYLDYTGMEKHWGRWQDFVYSLKAEIKRELGFTVNVGVSSNKLLAKMASDMEKPDKVHTLFLDEIEEKMWPMPIGDLFMVGRATSRVLHQSGIYTIGQIAKLPEEILVSKLKKQGSLIWRYANGLDDSPVFEEEGIKSLSQETTIPFDIKKGEDAYEYLKMLSSQVAARLRKYDLFGTVVYVHIKDCDFKTFSKQRKASCPVRDEAGIFRMSKNLFEEMWHNKPIRLIGVGVSGLTKECTEQLGLFSCDEQKNKLDDLIEEVKDKYGEKALMRGRIFS